MKKDIWKQLTEDQKNLRDNMNNRFNEHDKRFDEHDKRFDEHDKRFDEHDKRFDAIDKKFESIDNRFNRVEHAIFENLEEIISIKKHIKTLATKDDIRNIYHILDELLGLAKKNDQELTFMGLRITRLEKKHAN